MPARWRRAQRWKNTLIYGLLRLVYAGAARLPWPVLRALCLGLGRLAWIVDVPDRRRAVAQLTQAMPELSVAKHRRIIRGMFLHFGESVAELLCLERFLSGPRAIAFSAAQRALIDAALAEGKGVVAVTGHIGNWELLAQLLAVSGVPAATLAKPLYDPRLTRWVHALRGRHGLEVLWRGDDDGAKDILRVFRRGALLGLLIDQDTKVPGAFAPFFGRLAYTPTAAARFARRFGTPILVAWIQRVGKTHAVHVERCAPTWTDDEAHDLRAVTATLTARLEAAICAHPEQWVWLHRRWQRRPADEPGG